MIRPLGSDLSRIILAHKNKFGSFTKEIISYFKLLCQYCVSCICRLHIKSAYDSCKNSGVAYKFCLDDMDCSVFINNKREAIVDDN